MREIGREVGSLPAATTLGFSKTEYRQENLGGRRQLVLGNRKTHMTDEAPIVPATDPAPEPQPAPPAAAAPVPTLAPTPTPVTEPKPTSESSEVEPRTEVLPHVRRFETQDAV